MRKKKNKFYIPMPILMASNAFDEYNSLITKYGVLPAGSPKELADKLAELYKKVEDKVAFEKDLALIHPHRAFIEKYTTPKGDVIQTPAQNDEKGLVKNNGTLTTVHDGYANAQGEETMPPHSNACGCSGADGGGSPSMFQKDNNALAIVALVAVIGIVAIVHKK